MKKVRGMSAIEKQKAILDIFFESRDVFNKDEVEKEAKKRRVNSKPNGIRRRTLIDLFNSFSAFIWQQDPQEIQEILKNLVQDNLVCKDKVGVGSFFWSFPHEKKIDMEKVVNDLTERITQCKQKSEEALVKITAETQERSAEDRGELQEKYQELKEASQKKAKQLSSFQRVDPKKVIELKTLIETRRKLANFWTDNLEALLFFVKKKFFMSQKDLAGYKANLEIEDELQYIEETD